MPQTVVLVTGASSGIGYALAAEFAQRNYKVYAGARTLKKMVPLSEKYGVIPIELDITSKESIAKVRDQIAKENDGKLDVLYNNAGIAYRGSIFDMSEKELEHTFNVNVFGHIYVIQSFRDLLIKSRGLVAFTGSLVETMKVPFSGSYAASKCALASIAETFALEANFLGIKVLRVTTGAVYSEISEHFELPRDSIYHLEGDNGDKQLIGPISPDKQMPPAVYAKRVVNDVERQTRSGQLYKMSYRGVAATCTRIFEWLPVSWAHRVILRVFKLHEPFKKIYNKLHKRD